MLENSSSQQCYFRSWLPTRRSAHVDAFPFFATVDDTGGHSRITEHDASPNEEPWRLKYGERSKPRRLNPSSTSPPIGEWCAPCSPLFLGETMPSNKSQRKLASIAVAAECCDVSTKTIRRYIAAGRITGYRVGPRLIKIDIAELDRLLRPVGGAA